MLIALFCAPEETLFTWPVEIWNVEVSLKSQSAIMVFIVWATEALVKLKT